MRREGFEVNGKRVARIRREEGIRVSKKQRKRHANRLIDIVLIFRPYMS